MQGAMMRGPGHRFGRDFHLVGRALTRVAVRQGQEYSEVQLVLRVPRWQPAPAPAAAARRPTGDTALGVDGIELREQSHEEALLSTIGICLERGL